MGTYSATTNLDPGDDPATTENSNRLDLSKTYYDEWGRVYKSERYDDPADATPADALVTNTYYDRRGLVWAVDAPNTGIRFSEYDAAGRQTASSLGTQFEDPKYASSAPDFPDGNEGIVQRAEYTLDAVGRVQKTITKELNHNDTDGMDTSDFIRTYTYSWYDEAHRMTDSASHGTNNSDGWKDNSTAPTYGASAPSRSDTVLVTTYTYDAEGRRTKVTDPKNIAQLTIFDKLGRSTSKEEADGSAVERITNYAYNGLNSLTKITADLTTDQQTQYVYDDGQNARWVTKIHYPATDTDNGKTLGEPSEESYDTITFAYNTDGTLSTRTDQNGTVLTWDYDALRRKTEEEVTTVGTDVHGTIRALTWTYTSEGLVEYMTSHTDTTPDTSTWTDATNQIKYTYNAAAQVTKEEQEVDGAVDGNTLAVEYSYGTEYSTGNYNRLNYTEFPDDRKIWFGYTHSDTSGTFQDTVNGAFNRVGQIARDNSGSIGDILAQYDFNGTGRMVRRVHDEDTGAYGNDTRMDLWHGTSGDYDGLDRFGRIVDMKHTDFSTSTDFFRRSYTYDRDSNRTSIAHALHKADSQEFTYDDLNRLTQAKQGYLNTSANVIQSDVVTDYDMDLLGNFNGTNGIKLNSASAIKHTTNATNEITTLDYPNPAGAAAVISDTFDSSIAALWSSKEGTWSISSGQLNGSVSGFGSPDEAIILADADLDIMNYEFTVAFPTGSTSNKAGMVLSHDGDDTYYFVGLNTGLGGLLQISQITDDSWSTLASTSVTINENTSYQMKVTRKQRHITAQFNDGSTITHLLQDESTDLGTGQSGLYTDKTDTKFDNFKAYIATTRDSLVPRIIGLADAQISSGALLVTGDTRGGEAVVTGFSDDDYMVEVDVDLNSGDAADLFVRYQNANNAYRVRLESNSPNDITLHSLEDGKYTSLASSTFTGSTPAIKIKLSSTTIKVWVDGTLKINTTDSTHAAGTVALSGEQPTYDNLKVGYDNNADDDIEDAGDDLVVDETFASTSKSVTHDNNGNQTQSASLKYTYDAWNRLVEVQSLDDDRRIVTDTEYDAKGRRMKKEVENSGDLDGTMVYLYDGWKIVETRDGSNRMVQQFIHGTQYIDELVMMRRKGRGDLYVHQDANWNVIGLTDLGGGVVERYVYSPYGELTVHQETSYGDRDGDGVVDSTDKGTPGSTCTGTVTGACRILDLDFDGDYDSTDGSLFNALAQGYARHPGLSLSGVRQPFAHQGLLYDAEIASYQNRHRQYDPSERRFLQRDSLGMANSQAQSLHDDDPVNNLAFAPVLQYQTGTNLYEYLRSRTATLLDPNGLTCCSSPPDYCISISECYASQDAANDRFTQLNQACCAFFCGPLCYKECGLEPVPGQGIGGIIHDPQACPPPGGSWHLFFNRCCNRSCLPIF